MSKKDKLGRSWECLLKHDRKHIRFTTIIIDVIRVRENDARCPDRAKAISDQVSGIIDGFERDWLAITRGRRFPGMIWRGTFELELKLQPWSGGHTYALLQSIGCDMSPLAQDERYLVVHTHFVVVLPDELLDPDGEIAADEFRRVIQSVWTGKWQTQAKTLRAKSSVRENIFGIYKYVTKRYMRYSTGGVADVKVEFNEPYEPVWRRFVSSLYEGFESAFRSKR